MQASPCPGPAVLVPAGLVSAVPGPAWAALGGAELRTRTRTTAGSITTSTSVGADRACLITLVSVSWAMR